MKPLHFCVLLVSVSLWFSAKRGVDASCHPNPCLNGGICYILPNTTTAFCLCPRNYTGSSFCHHSNIAATTVKLTSSATTSSQSRTDRLPVQEVTTQSPRHVITESRNNTGISSTRQPTTNTRQMSSSGSTTAQALTNSAIEPDMGHLCKNNEAEEGENPVVQHSSTQPVNDVGSPTRMLASTTKARPYVVPATEKTVPKKGTKKQGRNYSLWFTWIVILLFVTSVLLLILAIALFISYGRVGPYNQDDERESQDYPPEEDDLNGRKQVFNLKFT